MQAWCGILNGMCARTISHGHNVCMEAHISRSSSSSAGTRIGRTTMKGQAGPGGVLSGLSARAIHSTAGRSMHRHGVDRFSRCCVQRLGAGILAGQVSCATLWLACQTLCIRPCRRCSTYVFAFCDKPGVEFQKEEKGRLRQKTWTRMIE